MPEHSLIQPTFRAAVATDADVAVPLIYSSGPAAFDYVFAGGKPGRALEFLRFAFVDGAGEFGYRNHVVAVLDNDVVGVGAAWDGRAGLSFMLAAAAQILRFFGPLRAIGVIARGLKVEQVIRPPRGDEYYIAHLGVCDPLRGKGIGAGLVRQLLGQTDRGRHRVAALDVAASNPRAEVLYVRLGFAVEALRQSTLRSHDHIVADHRRMRLPLA